MALLHGVSAAHLNTPQRLLRFEQMVASWAHQEVPCPLTVSLSLGPNMSHGPALERLAVLQQQHADLDIHVAPLPLRQGLHYRRLVRLALMGAEHRNMGHWPSQSMRRITEMVKAMVTLAKVAKVDLARQLLEQPPAAPWLLFTDDDDLWAPDRTNCVIQGITTGSNMEQSPAAVLFPKHVRHRADIPDIDRRACLHVGTPQGALASSYKLDDASHVAEALSSKALMTSTARSFGMSCYWAYVVRRSALQDFMQAASDKLLSERCWDLCLLKFLHSRGVATVDADEGTMNGSNTGQQTHGWMYYWRIDTAAAQGTSNAASVLQQGQQNPPSQGSSTVQTTSQTLQELPGEVQRQLQGKRLQALLEVFCACHRDFDPDEFAAFAAAQGLQGFGTEQLHAAFKQGQPQLHCLLASP